MQQIKDVYAYKETNNPYAHNEQISITRIENDNQEKYFEFFISNDFSDGCGIYLSINEFRNLLDKLETQWNMLRDEKS